MRRGEGGVKLPGRRKKKISHVHEACSTGGPGARRATETATPGTSRADVQVSRRGVLGWSPTIGRRKRNQHPTSDGTWRHRCTPLRCGRWFANHEGGTTLRHHRRQMPRPAEPTQPKPGTRCPASEQDRTYTTLPPGPLVAQPKRG